MAEVSRNDEPLRNPEYPHGAGGPSERDNAPEGGYLQAEFRALPPARGTAYAAGRRIGAAVAQVGRVRRNLDRGRSNLREELGRKRANASARVLEMMDTAACRAEDLRETARNNATKLAGRASRRASELGDRAAERWERWRRDSRDLLQDAGRQVEARWRNTRVAVEKMQREDPVRFLTIVAGSAFVVGASLRIWRAGHD